jgi:hypothetical protein
MKPPTLTKLQAVEARTALMQKELPDAPLNVVRWFGRKHYGGGAGFGMAVDRLLDDPNGDGGDAFVALLDQLRYYADTLRQKSRS